MPNTSVPAAGNAMPATEVMPILGRFSRRALLGVIASVPALAVATASSRSKSQTLQLENEMPAAAVEQPDAELFQIETKFNSAYAIYEDVADKVGEIEERVFRLKPPKPAKLPGTHEIKATFWEMARGIDPNGTDDSWLAHPAAVAWRENDRESRQRLEAWQAECEEIIRKSGLREAEEERDRLMSTAGDIAESLLDKRAQTLAGMLVKLRVHQCWTFDEYEILDTLTADIKAMAGGVS